MVPGFHRLIPKPKEEAEPKPLFHTSALIHGEYPPCYYCGDRRYEPSQCPSKKLLPVSEGLEKAGYLSHEAPGDRFHRDFRASCVSGFLEMEQESFRFLERHFLNAAERTKTTPQKIFVLFQLFRLSDVMDNPIKAESRLEEILRLDSECPEALYHEAILKFRKGQNREALAQLRWLIRMHRAFYIRAWIDPDLSAFALIIHPALTKMLKRTEEKAAQVMETAVPIRVSTCSNTAQVSSNKKVSGSGSPPAKETTSGRSASFSMAATSEWPMEATRPEYSLFQSIIHPTYKGYSL